MPTICFIGPLVWRAHAPVPIWKISNKLMYTIFVFPDSGNLRSSKSIVNYVKSCHRHQPSIPIWYFMGRFTQTANRTFNPRARHRHGPCPSESRRARFARRSAPVTGLVGKGTSPFRPRHKARLNDGASILSGPEKSWLAMTLAQYALDRPGPALQARVAGGRGSLVVRKMSGTIAL